MLMSNISLDTSSPGAPSGDPAAGAAALVPDGEGFADRLAQAQSALPAGQNLAAGALPLQTLALGPTLEVITASGGTDGDTDSDSLAEFAKSQGLDDDVVAWLFSDSTQAQIQAQVQQKATVYVHSRYLSQEQVRQALLEPALSVEGTLAELVKQYGPQARIGILPEGPQTVPYLSVL